MSKLFKVGGCVRDKFLGLNSKDIDFTFVSDNTDQTVGEGFKEMEQFLSDNNFEVFLSTPDCFTIRAKFPKGDKNEGLVADFVMARKEVGYIPNTRRPILELGTLEDDLIRRDFTVNALAEDEDGNLIDLFGGMQALSNKILITPQPPQITMLEDPLRVLRAMRFSITKGFKIDFELQNSMVEKEVINKMASVVSKERIREELEKMFQSDTIGSLNLLSKFNRETNGRLFNILFSGNLRLTPTMKL